MARSCARMARSWGHKGHSGGPDSPPVTMQYVYTVERQICVLYMPQIQHLCIVSTRKDDLSGKLFLTWLHQPCIMSLPLKRAKHLCDISSYQSLGGASRMAGGEIPQHFV